MRKVHAFAAICISAATIPVAEPARALDQITACVEVAPAAMGAFAFAGATRSDCSPPRAIARAVAAAHTSAASGLRDFCRANVTAAMAAATCAAHGMSRPTAAGTQARLPPVAAFGSPPIDFWRGIGRTAAGPLCAVVRDRPEDMSTNTEAEILCVLDNFTRTIIRARVSVRCAVQCL